MCRIGLTLSSPDRGGFDELEPIWWHSDGDGDPLSHTPEPEGALRAVAGARRSARFSVLSFPSSLRRADVFLERVSRFRAWLAARPERVIAVVSHWGVLDALTQLEFANCEVRPARARRAARHVASRHACAAMRVLAHRGSRPDARARPRARQMRSFPLHRLRVRAPQELVPPG